MPEMNGHQFKTVKLKDDFVWHTHPETDEAFAVLDGDLRIDIRDSSVNVSAGELFVIPKAVGHTPYAGKEVKMLFFELRVC